jgi:structural maintenance of chromosome 1
MDAISFVLGIKSSHLRSSHLRDLVYRGRVLKTSVINEDGSATVNGAGGDANGASHEKERGDPKAAWVLAVYEDDAGEEQLWKRIITSSGSSEYRINNKVVSAQQYNDALESENILIKARNFLCFQGDVEQIASQSPRDLTRLIEQISGSLEYKADYERLKQVQDDAIENQNYTLNRRRGINSEIKQYQEQKREADQFSKKAEERDHAVVRHILYKLYRFQALIEQSGNEIQNQQEELKEFRRAIASYEEDLEESKKDQGTVIRQVAKIERSMKSKERQAEEKESSLVPTVEKIHLTKENMMKVQSRIATIAKERDSKTEAIKQFTKDLKTVEKAEGQWESEWRKTAAEEGINLNEADLEEYSKLKEEANRRTSSDQIKVNTLARQERADDETVKSLESSVKMQETQVKKVEAEITEITQSLADAKDTVKTTTKEMEGKKKEINGLTSERLRIRQLRTELDEKLYNASTKLLEAEGGRNQSRKEMHLKTLVSDMKRMFPGVRGRVTDLCTPKQKKYTEAVSTALGRHLDSVVVEDEKTARDCISYLRDHRRGEATFIPLDTISVQAINSNLKNLKGTRMAIDCIDYDRAVDRAMLYACGNSIICDDLKTARHVCYEKGVETKAITLDGSVIHKGGLMTGGRGPQQNAKRWEDSEIDNLRKVVEQQHAKIQELPDVRRNAAEEEQLQSQLAGLEQKLIYAREELSGFERNLKSKQSELSHAKKELSSAKPRLSQRRAEMEKLRAELKSARDSIQKVENDLFASFCKRLNVKDISVFEAQQGTLQQEASQRRLEFKQQKSRLENRMNFEQQQMTAVTDRIKGLEVRLKQDQSLVKELEKEKKSIANEADTLTAQIDDLKTQLEEQRTVLDQKAEVVAEKKREVQKRSRNIENANRTIAGLESDIQRHAADKFALLRKCKLEDIVIPLQSSSNSLDAVPVDGLLQNADADPDAMEVDGEANELQSGAMLDYGIEVDFDELDDDLKEVRWRSTPGVHTNYDRMMTPRSRMTCRAKLTPLMKSSKLWHPTCARSSG